MKNKDIISLTDKDLLGKVKEEKASLNKMLLNHSITPLENPLKIRENRRNVARLKTEASKRINNTTKK
jgi:large subunit ribosomal protein L29